MLSDFVCSFWLLLALERSGQQLTHLIWNIQCRNCVWRRWWIEKKAFFHFAKLLLSFLLWLFHVPPKVKLRVNFQHSIDVHIFGVGNIRVNNRLNNVQLSRCLIYDIQPSEVPPSSTQSLYLRNNKYSLYSFSQVIFFSRVNKSKFTWYTHESIDDWEKKNKNHLKTCNSTWNFRY